MTDEETHDSETPPTASTLDYEKLAEALRSRMDWFGKALAALATLGTTAVSLATVQDLAPSSSDDKGPWIASAVALLCLLAAGLSAVVVAVRLMRVNQPVVLDADPTAAQEFGQKADEDVQLIYKTVAEQNGFTTLSGLQGQVRALRVTARNAPSEAERDRRTSLADEGQTAVDGAIARARWAVVRRQAAEAAGGMGAQLLYLTVLVGLLGFAYSADIATGPEKDSIDNAKACAEARKASAIPEDLEDTTCATASQSESPSETPDAPSSLQERATLSEALMALVHDCTDLIPKADPSSSGDAPGSSASPTVEDRPLTDDECAGIAALAASIYKSPSS